MQVSGCNLSPAVDHMGGKRYKCEWPGCGVRADWKCHIKQHYSRVHLKEKNFQCHLCHYKTFKKYDLQKHMKTHTKDGHDIKKCDDCGQQQLHIKTGRRKRIQTPAAAAAVRLSESPNQLRDSDSGNGSESSARSQRNQCPDVSVPHCTSSRRSDIGESGRNCTAESQPNGPTCSFNWDKRCHVCCKQFVFENNLQLHMLSHKKEGHDMVRCEYCRVHLACTQRTGCRSRFSLVVDSRLLVLEQPVDDKGEDDTENQESGSKEMDMNDDGDGDSDSRSSHDRDDGMSSHMADEGKGAPAATGIFQKMINRCTRFCRNLTNHKSWTGNAAAGSSDSDVDAEPAASGETELLVSGSQQELEQMSGNIWHDAIQEQGTSAAGNDEQTGAGHQGEEETEVVDLSDDEDMSIPLITIAD